MNNLFGATEYPLLLDSGDCVSFKCIGCRNRVEMNDTSIDNYNLVFRKDGDKVKDDKEVVCEHCSSVFMVRREGILNVSTSLTVTDSKVILLDPQHKESEEAMEFAGKSVGDKVNLQNGVYRGNLFEYHVENHIIVHKFNAHTDENQLNMDSSLFPNEMPLQFAH